MVSLRRLFAGAVERVGLGRLAVAAGVALLLAAVWTPAALALDEPNTYRYEASEVRFTDDGIDGAVGELADSDVACLGRAHRNCALERHVLEEGEVALTHPRLAATNDAAGHSYASLDGQFYRTTVEHRNDSTVLGLEPLAREDALGYASTSLGDVPDPVARAVAGETVTTHERLALEGELIRGDGGQYHVVHTVESHTRGGSAADEKRLWGSVEEGVVTGLLFLSGLGLILKGQRWRLRGL